MGEQRFKVGDWVRSLVDWGSVEAGKVYKIPHLDDEGEPWFTSDGDGGWCDYLTLDEIEPWKPRVGERVKFTDKVPKHWFFGPTKNRKDGVIESVEGRGFSFDVKADGAICYVNIEHIEPILSTATLEQPATFKIEAGKFYKTRDGRKAKVERAHYGDSYDFVATFEGWPGNKVYKKDGKHGSRWIDNNPSDDLIAEWIGEPVAKAKPSNDNAQPKFKVGDLVRVVKTGFVSGGSGHSAKIGDEFVLREMNPSKAFWRTNGPDFYEHEIELVVFASIVALIENGQPKPSSTPHVHASTGAAEKEAKRLAAKHKGQQFGVFTLTTTHHESKPVYDHKWQNMAAMGLKIDAIKELRAVAGIDLLTAKRAVEAFDAAA